MRIGLLLCAAVAAGLGACNQGAETTAANQAASAAVNAAAAKARRPTYCFFKDADTKGWKAARDASGDVVVDGKAHLDDNRYAAQLGQPEIFGTSGSLWLTMGPNAAAYGAPENWWDVKASLPNSSGIDTVKVMCGTKTVVELKVPAAR